MNELLEAERACLFHLWSWESRIWYIPLTLPSASHCLYNVQPWVAVLKCIRLSLEDSIIMFWRLKEKTFQDKLIDWFKPFEQQSCWTALWRLLGSNLDQKSPKLACGLQKRHRLVRTPLSIHEKRQMGSFRASLCSVRRRIGTWAFWRPNAWKSRKHTKLS